MNAIGIHWSVINLKKKKNSERRVKFSRLNSNESGQSGSNPNAVTSQRL